MLVVRNLVFTNLSLISISCQHYISYNGKYNFLVKYEVRQNGNQIVFFFFLRNSAWRVLNTSLIFNLVNSNQPASHSMRNKKIMANSFWTRLGWTVMKIRGKVMTPCCNISNNSIINCSEGVVILRRILERQNPTTNLTIL